MGRLAYAAMVPHEMPSVMSEFAHIDHARYHAAHELFKEDHGVDLDGHITEFWGTKITPPRPTDGSVEKLKAAARAPAKGAAEKNVRKINADLWKDNQHHTIVGYVDADAAPNITGPDHRLSYLPLHVIEMLFPHLFESDEASPGTEQS